ncbi:MAG: TlyA family RNA methyltransferase [Christensenellaceae bacterium]
MSERADKFFAERFGSRSKAAHMLEKGLILRGGKPLKASDQVSESDEIVFLSAGRNFVSNGGYKLERLLTHFPIDVRGKVFVDMGASTGGYTDCLLQHGARRVYAVDVGESLLDPSLASNERVIVMDKTNARYLSASDFPERIDGVSVDVSFISLTLLFEGIDRILSDGGEVYALIKPQFECGGDIGKSGILRDAKRRAKIACSVLDKAKTYRLMPQGIINAPLSEKKNVEYVVWLKKGATKQMNDDEIGIALNTLT